MFYTSHVQRGDKRLLRNVELAELRASAFAFLLLLAFGGDVLAEGAHGQTSARTTGMSD